MTLSGRFETLPRLSARSPPGTSRLWARVMADYAPNRNHVGRYRRRLQGQSVVFLLQRQESGVAAGGGGVDRKGALGGKAVEVARAAGLGAGAGEPLAAK